MPPRNVRGAQSHSAQMLLGAKTPDGLDTFLGGFAAGGCGSSPEEEGSIAVNLKLLTKSSDITKQKALAELIQRIPVARDEVLGPFVPGCAEAVIRHVHYINPEVRAAVFTLLKVLMAKGKLLKMTLVRDLPALAPVWLMGMNDMEAAVRREAREAFEAAFSTEKRQEMLERYTSAIVDGLMEAVKGIVNVDGKPLQGDTVDQRANVLYSALGAMGYMVKQVSASQTAVMSFVLDRHALGKILPCRYPERNYMAAKTPLVRSATLALLRDLIAVCPCAPKLHQQIGTVVHGAILDKDVTIAARLWELLLFWCRRGVADVITCLPKGFFDNVVDSFMDCTQPELADIIFPCLFPFLTQLSKDPRCIELLDEFCGALVEKFRLLKETHNVSAQELSVILQALLECWELHCVRMKSTSAAYDSAELFAVICVNIIQLLEVPAKRQRYQEVVVAALTKSLLKTSGRNEATFCSCLLILADEPETVFKVLPEDPSDAVLSAYRYLRGSVVGNLYTLAVREGTYGRQLPRLQKYLMTTVQQQMEQDDPEGLAPLLSRVEGTYKLPADIAAAVVAYILRVVPRLEKEEDGPNSEERCRSCKELLTLALTWENSQCLTCLSDAVGMSDVREAVRDHLLRDPAKAFDMLVASCEANSYHDIERCVGHLVDAAVSLTAEQRATLLNAVVDAWKGTLQLVQGTDSSARSSDGSEDGSSKHSADSSSIEVYGGDGVDDDTSGDSRSSSSQVEKDSEDALNEAPELLSNVAEWCVLLTAGKPLAHLMQLNKDLVESRLAELLYWMTIAVAPRVYPEHYTSLKALRVALMNRDGDALSEAIEEKMHGLDIRHFTLLVEGVEAFLESYAVSAVSRDAFAWQLMLAVAEEEVPPPLLAVHQLQQIIPYASTALLCRVVADSYIWERFAVRSVMHDADTMHDSNHLSLFDGYYSLSQLHVTLTTVVRSAQLLRLIDSAGLTDEAVMERIPPVPLLLHLLQLASAREAFPHVLWDALIGRIFPSVYARVNTAAAAAELVAAVLSNKNECLLCTLAAVLRDLAKTLEPSEHMNFVLRTRRVVGAATEQAIKELFTPEGARGISSDTVTIFTTFFALMDEAADVVRENMLGPLPKDVELLFLEASCMLPIWDKETAKLSLVVHRHISTMPVVAENTCRGLVEYAQKQSPFDCIEILAQLSCTRVLSLSAFSEVVRVIINSLCRCYTLQHLPTNGRLQSAPPSGLRPASLSFERLRRIAVDAMLARRGVIIHSRMDDALRSTVNLVIFDSVCEAVSRMRTTQEEEVPRLAKLIAFTSAFMTELSTSDVSVLRSSEASVGKIASVMCYAYMWLSASSISRIEAIGMDTVAAVMRSVCLLANLTLVRSGAALHEPMRVMMEKISLKPLREEFSATTPLKLTPLRRLNALIAKTHKQKLLFFPYLLAWCVYLTTPATEEEAEKSGPTAQKAWRLEVYRLLDVLCALLLTPQIPRDKSVEGTYLGAALAEAGRDDLSAVGALGFEVVSLTRTTAEDTMGQLARGAAAVLSLLLRGPTLAHVKNWIVTLERKVQAMLFAFVERHISPVLIQEDLLTVLSHSPDGGDTFPAGENMLVHVGSAQRRIELRYELEDAKATVCISLPSDYPLSAAAVEHSNRRECGVSTEKWRGWLLKMTAMLFSGGANIWDCVALFGRNMEAHLGGQEPCPICFAVVSVVSRKLPELRCSVCQNSAFHANCLYTWWAHGGQNVCPLCRSPWISE